MIEFGRKITIVALNAALIVFLFYTTASSAQLESPLGGGGNLSLPGFDSAKPSEPKVSMTFSPATAVVGEEITATIEVKTDRAAYVYSQNPNIGAETKISLEEIVGLEPIDEKFKPSKDPKVVVEPLFDDAKLEKFYGGVSWSRKYRVTGSAAPKITGELKFQVCDDSTCNQFTKPILLQAKLGPAASEPSLVEMLEAKPKIPDMPEDIFEPKKAETLPLISGTVLAETSIDPKREFGGPDPIHINVKLLNTSGSDESVKTVVLAITAKVDGDWHLYAQTQDPEMFGIPTEINVPNVEGLKAIDARFLPIKQPEIVKPDVDIVQQVFHHEITWQKRYQLDQASFKGPITGSLMYQLCEESGSCLPPNTVNFELLGNAGAAQASLETTDDKAPAETVTGPVEEEVAIQDQGLIPFLLTGIIFGYMALLTPCVFPMIPITVSFFLKQAEAKHHKPFGMAFLYCLGIISTFTIIGIFVSAVFGAAGMNMVANNPWFNLFLAGVLVFFGMSMLGLFEIRVPSWLLTWSSSKEGQGGVLGVLFMSFTFTLVSFTCTFAFVGLLLPMAAQGNYYWPALGMIAFSAAFSSPFFLLALFPSYLKKLPKSGGWMNNVKVIFGLMEIGAAFKFLSVADIVIFTTPYIFDYALVMTSWMVLCIVAGLYLLGMFKLPSDSASDSIGALRLAFAISFLGFAAYLSSGIYGAQKPEGILWEQIAAFAPPSYKALDDVELGPALEHDELLYALDVDQAIEYAKATNTPLFFDFTGTNCVNCRFMEVNVFPKEENHKLLKNFVRVQLYTDSIPDMNKELAQELLVKNRRLQSDWFNDATMPAYAVVTPDGETILSSYKGAEREQGQFTRFLKAGLDEWQRKAAMAGTPVRR
ncbi:cytochrome c biogenesis protein CcdA [Rubinisphaera sp.]|uniref:protein-disulfide reductase DsbD family protein n=1 Tax=Rubinisphaera sp. TaxID=2024857 RepID=UPI000C0F85B9|nr:cytochrome c biogenesis protein CcdA [Rubinisphaera sp.]MBV08160.1 hypothetical protein [Rubinisphaera sp.]HCS50779.1 hypothetical protein [Planctomycetaceae bacterium]|tara:strand:- start:208 stop:2832 length:2625 start_codon:yes stop_codon:yes gene_type:complete